MAGIESYTTVRATDRLLSMLSPSHTPPVNTSSDNIPLRSFPATSLSTDNLAKSTPRPRIFRIPYQNKLQLLSVAVHVLAVAITIVIVQLRLHDIYWFDQTAKAKVFGHEIRAESNTSALQFAAKIHEALIQASLTAMAFHVIRLMLRGEGVSFGVLDGVYRFGSVPWLWSKGLWGALHKPSHHQNFLLAIGLALAAVYANVVAPSSAILLTPTLDWWEVQNPFNGRNFTTVIRGNSSVVYPSHFKSDNNCEIYPTSVLCPGAGYFSLGSLLQLYNTDEIDLETQIKLPVSKSYRKLSSTLDFNNYTVDNEGLAVATTSHTSIVTLAGLLWNYIYGNEVGEVNDIERPQFRPKVQDIRSPLVQVQCSPFSWIDATKKNRDPIFQANNLRSLNQLVKRDDTDNYQRIGNRTAKREYWNHRESTLHIPTFSWVNASDLFEDPSLSLAAVATVPAYYLKDGKATKDSIILPCMIDARWVDISMDYDPTMDNTIHTNFTDLMSLHWFWDTKNMSDSPGGFTSPNVRIDTEWAQLLNTNTTHYYRLENGQRNVSSIEALLGIFIKRANETDNTPRHFVPPYNTRNGRKLGDYAKDETAVRPYINEISNTVAAILSLAVVDGMSRTSHIKKVHLITEDFHNGSFRGVEDFWEQHHDEEEVGSEIFEVENTDGMISIDWEVRKFGWGYGRLSPPIYFAMAALFIHVALVLAFGIYMAIFLGTWRTAGQVARHDIRVCCPGIGVSINRG